MSRYILHRFLLIIPAFIGITIVCFFITQLLPGGPVEQALQKIMTNNKAAVSRMVENDEKENLKRIYGFDKPFILQYFRWFTRILRGDFGYSLISRSPVLEEIGVRIPISLLFGFTGFLIACLICLPLGIARALKPKSFSGRLGSIITCTGYALPGFILGILLLLIFGNKIQAQYHYFPRHIKLPDFIQYIILPIACYAVSGFAIITYRMKISIAKELRENYIIASLAKGLPFKKVFTHHVLKNAIIPFIADLGSFCSTFFTGLILIEKIFNIPGIGLYGFDAIIQHDYPIVIGLIMLQSVFILIGRFISQISLALIDPRKRLAKDYIYG